MGGIVFVWLAILGIVGLVVIIDGIRVIIRKKRIKGTIQICAGIALLIPHLFLIGRYLGIV